MDTLLKIFGKLGLKITVTQANPYTLSDWKETVSQRIRAIL